MECRKITIARLRSGVNYKEPLKDILDSYYYLLQRFSKENGPKQKLLWGNYNFGFDSANRRKDDDGYWQILGKPDQFFVINVYHTNSTPQYEVLYNNVVFTERPTIKIFY